MSGWQAYVDQNLIGSGSITKGAIFGVQGGKWASSSNFKITDAEAAAIVSGFTNQATGSFMVEGNKYIKLRADDSSIYGKLGKGGFIAVKTAQSLIIGVYEDPIQPGPAAVAVEKLGDYLKEVGY